MSRCDLNRAFPGRSEGFLTQRIAALLVKKIVERADFLVDIHRGGLAYDLVPYVGSNSTPGPVGEASFGIAQSVGIELLYGSTPFPSVLRLEAARRHIPTILVEVGGGGRLNGDLVPIVQHGLEQVAHHVGILGGPSQALLSAYRVLKAPSTCEFIQAPTGGFLVSHARLGDEVERSSSCAKHSA